MIKKIDKLFSLILTGFIKFYKFTKMYVSPEHWFAIFDAYLFKGKWIMILIILLLILILIITNFRQKCPFVLWDLRLFLLDSFLLRLILIYHSWNSSSSFFIRIEYISLVLYIALNIGCNYDILGRPFLSYRLDFSLLRNR